MSQLTTPRAGTLRRGRVPPPELSNLAAVHVGALVNASKSGSKRRKKEDVLARITNGEDVSHVHHFTGLTRRRPRMQNTRKRFSVRCES